MGKIILPGDIPSDRFIKQTKEEYASILFKKKGVRGVGIGFKVRGGITTTELAICVSVKEKLQLSELFDHDKIPPEIHGVKTDVVVFSEIKSLALSSRVRPAQPGFSIGHTSVSAGTFGCLVMRGPNRCILSNNHILAAENNGHIGDAIVQPGPFDGGGATNDTVAYLDKYPSLYNGCNADCATATQANEESISGNMAIINATPTGALEMGGERVRDQEEGFFPNFMQRIGVPITKIGRTTEITVAPLRYVDYDVLVTYDMGDLLICDGIVTGVFLGVSSQGGDSGSLGMVGTTAVGLLFAGGFEVNYAGWYGLTFFNKIINVCSACNCYIGDIQTGTPIIANKTR